jgi:hypothetical protein
MIKLLITLAKSRSGANETRQILPESLHLDAFARERLAGRKF